MAGSVFFLAGLAGAAWFGINRLLAALGMISLQAAAPAWGVAACAVLLLIGLQFVFLGILGEYIGRISRQVKGRPQYIIEEKAGFSDEE